MKGRNIIIPLSRHKGRAIGESKEDALEDEDQRLHRRRET
jgi:hypothetical protein